MQAAAQGKVAYEQAKDDRDFALKQQLAQQGVYDTQARMRLARDAQSQGAYEFEASRQPSGRDMFAAQQHRASIDQHAQIEEARFTRQDQLRMSQLERQMGILKEMKDKKQIGELGYAEGVAQLHGMLGPLRLQQQQAQTQQQEMQTQQMMDQHAQMEVLLGSDHDRAAERIRRNFRTVDGVRYHINPNNGNVTALNDNQHEQNMAYVQRFGRTRAGIENDVVDSFRRDIEAAAPNGPRLTDGQVRNMIDPSEFDRAVQDSEERVLAGRSATRPGTTLTANATGVQQRFYLGEFNRQLTDYNNGVPKKPGDPVPQRPRVLQEYIATLSPMARGSLGLIDSLAQRATGGANPIPAEVINSAREWYVQREMARHQQVAQITDRADDPNAAQGQGGQSGQTAAPPVATQTRNFNQLINLVTNPDGTAPSPIGGEQLSAARTTMARTWNNDIPLVNRAARFGDSPVALTAEASDILIRADDAGRNLTVAERARINAIVTKIEAHKLANDALVRQRRQSGGSVPTNNVPGMRISYSQLLDRLRLPDPPDGQEDLPDEE